MGLFDRLFGGGSAPGVGGMEAGLSIGFQARPANFRSPALRRLWTDVRGVSHAQFPFLDREYSPNSLIPATDYSSWVAERISEGDWNAIWELLGFISAPTEVDAIRQTLPSLNFGRFVQGQSALSNHLLAVAIVAYRVQDAQDGRNRLWLLHDLYAEILASHPFEVQPDAVEFLLEGGNKAIRRINREGLGIKRLMLTADGLAGGNIPPVSKVGELLGSYPVTFPACIDYSMDRGARNVGSAFRPDPSGHYGLRQFGLCSEWTARYFAECGFFGPPTDVGAIAGRLNKEQLLAVASQAGVAAAKTWKKIQLTEALMDNPAARALLAARVPADLIEVRPVWADAFEAWRARVKALGGLALCLACI